MYLSYSSLTYQDKNLSKKINLPMFVRKATLIVEKWYFIHRKKVLL